MPRKNIKHNYAFQAEPESPEEFIKDLMNLADIMVDEYYKQKSIKKDNNKVDRKNVKE